MCVLLSMLLLAACRGASEPTAMSQPAPATAPAATPGPTEEPTPTATSRPAPATTPAATPQPTETESNGDSGTGPTGMSLTFKSVSAGGADKAAHTCGVKTDDSVACWGHDCYGQSTPPEGPFVSVSASAGALHTCGVRTDDSVVCWGWNGEGQANHPEGSVVSVSAGKQHTCGLTSDGSVACWGSDGDGQATPQAAPATGRLPAPSNDICYLRQRY